MLFVTKDSTFSSLFSGSGVYILHNSGTFFPLIGKKGKFFKHSTFFHKTKDPDLPFCNLWGITTPVWFKYFPYPMLLWTKWLSFECMSQYSQLLEIVLLVSTVCAKMRAAAYQTKHQDKNPIFAAKFCCMLDPYSIILN